MVCGSLFLIRVCAQPLESQPSRQFRPNIIAEIPRMITAVVIIILLIGTVGSLLFSCFLL